MQETSCGRADPMTRSRIWIRPRSIKINQTKLNALTKSSRSSANRAHVFYPNIWGLNPSLCEIKRLNLIIFLVFIFLFCLNFLMCFYFILFINYLFSFFVQFFSSFVYIKIFCCSSLYIFIFIKFQLFYFLFHFFIYIKKDHNIKRRMITRIRTQVLSALPPGYHNYTYNFLFECIYSLGAPQFLVNRIWSYHNYTYNFL